MDYMFYTPPNTQPQIDHSVPFDQDLALLEGNHYMAAQQVVEIEQQIASVPTTDGVGEEISAESRNAVVTDLIDRRDAMAAQRDDYEQQIDAARRANQDGWDAYRAEHTVEEPAE